MNEQLFGTIDKIVFESADTGFSVFVLLSKKEKITVTGTFSHISAGQEISLEGQWSYHQKFGKQFQATHYTTQAPTSIKGLKKYLGSGLIKGIGKVYAEKLVDYFGTNILTIIDETPEKLYAVPGVGKKRVQQIIASWHDQRHVARIMVFLQDKGVSTTYATKIYKKYGVESIAKLTQNPYRLVDDIWGIGFKMADTIAQNLGFDQDSIPRIKAGIAYTISQDLSQGNIYCEVNDLKAKSFAALELDAHTYATHMKQALTELYEQDKIKLISEAHKHFITLTSLYIQEYGIAQKLKKIMQNPSIHDISLQQVYKNLQNIKHIELHEQQQKAILSCFEHKVAIITGGPGTGKTTTIQTLLTLLDTYKIRYKLAAPTGRAAKRMMESTKKQAATIHRLLKFDPATFQFHYNESNALPTDFFIIDEASMIDVHLMYSIMKATSQTTHIIFIGDTDQLPSVGPGNILHDMIASNAIAATHLTQIFRQAQNSMIVQNAHHINEGNFPSSSIPGCKKDYYFIKIDDAAQGFAAIKRAYAEILPAHKITADHSIVLTPMNKGIVGTATLNHNLQQLLNPYTHKTSVSHAGITYKPQDRVMQIRNNYDKNVFNGDTGIIESIDQDVQTLTIAFDMQTHTYYFDELSEIVPAYAVTIHKSQGSEYDAVIVPLFMQHFTLLQRNLLYTAITRAKRLCIVIGQAKAIAMAIKNNAIKERITFLASYLTKDISCR